MTPRDRAQAAQREASDPAVSAFVAASAGSGKTKLLTDRLLRLMLGGADPARIQCLTFTKAAAAEMALRLQRTLGAWVTLGDTALDARLRELDVAPDRRQDARALFARVLDLPGGMRIGTIHAFCQSLLRRFPLEARLSPHFTLVDDNDAAASQREAREDVLGRAGVLALGDALALVAGLASMQQFGQTLAAFQQHRERLAAGPVALAEAQRRALGVTGTDASLIADAVTWPQEQRLGAAVRMALAQGSDKVAEKAERLLGWLGLDPGGRAEHWGAWREEFLRPDGALRGPTVLANLKLARAHPGLQETFVSEQHRVAEVEDQLRARRVAVVSAALVALAGPAVRSYAQRKEHAAQLDYDDLIGLTSRLLVDPGAAWVLFKLDGGLDHLLLDEVQDTAPAQWEIAGALTKEFFAGAGANPARRTVFAVGDRKQSIYSFQGADPDQFDRWRDILSKRVGDAGENWRDVALDVSFRSTIPVLALVDAVFAAAPAAQGVTDIGALHHIAARAGHAGRVELWPLVPPPELPQPEPWTVPETNLGGAGAPERLADALAEWIRARCGVEPLPSKGRTLAPGDILILLRRRNSFARLLVRALKIRGVAVAGLDRMVLTDQPAIADLLALCDVLLLPQDDLALACVLASPIGGLSEDSLLALAAERPGTLWEALIARASEAPEWRAAHALIVALLRRVDYASPFALLSEALGALGARARLFARLGAEAAEPIDELLNAALSYAEAHPPSLQGFVLWLRQSGAEIKREAEAAGNAVRIMTVHGAKGLQAPLVILPDTTSLPPDDGSLLWTKDGVPLWAPNAAFRCAAIEALRAPAAERRAEEYNRLLYVALTRAEDRLIVCGWEPRKVVPPECWYALVRAGFGRLDAQATAFDAVSSAWMGEMLALESPQTVPPEAGPSRGGDTAPAALPDWIGAAPGWQPRPPPEEPALPSPLAPSRPENAGMGQVPMAASPLALRDATGRRFQRGQLVHALLQHLPALPVAARTEAARSFLGRSGLAAGDVTTLVAEVLAVLSDVVLADLFGSHGRAEVPLTGVIAGRVIGGLVDRLAVLPDRVLIADYKTNRSAPTRAEAVPELYLRQMAAYRAVLRAVFPGRAVTCVLVWTTGPRTMALPDSLLDRHDPAVTAAA